MTMRKQKPTNRKQVVQPPRSSSLDAYQAPSTRYQPLSFDRTKLYSPLEAITLAQQSATNKFDGKIEVHAVVTKTGKFGEYATERKAPLLHTVLGKQSEKPETLLAELEKLVKAADPRQIKKLVVCATMGPGVKVDLSSFSV